MGQVYSAALPAAFSAGLLSRANRAGSAWNFVRQCSPQKPNFFPCHSVLILGGSATSMPQMGSFMLGSADFKRVRHPCRHPAGIFAVFLREFFNDQRFLFFGQKNVTGDKDGRHDQRYEGRPLDEKTENDDNEPSVLRMADMRIRARRDDFTMPLMNGVPSFRHNDRAGDDHDIAQCVKKCAMIRPDAEKRNEEINR